MKGTVSSFVVGLIFALGLGVAGMTRPENIISFLDIFGHWSPSLIFVMAGAVGIHTIFYALIRRRKSPLFAKSFDIPGKKDLTLRLIVGSSIFGIGWGVAGYCPAPAIVSLAGLGLPSVVFVASMLLGMRLSRVFVKS